MDCIFNAMYGECGVSLLLIYKVLPTGCHDIDKKGNPIPSTECLLVLYYSTDRIILEWCCMLENGCV